jgi:hypothetical protein
MKSETYPLALPSGLLQEARQAAKETGLSLPDAMRQSLKLGLPRLREQLAGTRITNVLPLSDKIARELYSQPDDDADAIKDFIQFSAECNPPVPARKATDISSGSSGEALAQFHRHAPQ